MDAVKDSFLYKYPKIIGGDALKTMRICSISGADPLPGKVINAIGFRGRGHSIWGRALCIFNPLRPVAVYPHQADIPTSNQLILANKRHLWHSDQDKGR
jgi:hypothetical protein